MSRMPSSSSDKIYHFIISAIAQGKLKAHDRIKEQELVKETGLSRTPIREALTLLQNEGILSQDGRNALVVTGLDLISMTKLYELRENLEIWASKLATRHISKIEIEVLYNIIQSGKKLSKLSEVRANNLLFHQTIYRCASNPYLIKIMKNLEHSLLLLGESTLTSPQRQAQAHEEHLSIVKAMQRGDEEEAAKRAEFHIKQAYKMRLEQFLQKDKD